MRRHLLLATLLLAGCRDLGFRAPAADAPPSPRAPRCFVTGTMCGTNDDCCSGKCGAPGGGTGPATCR